jgi:hypothetical protein
MTPATKKFIMYMLESNFYLMKQPLGIYKSNKAYKLFKDVQVPIMWVSEAMFRYIEDIVKTNKSRQITLNLSKVRQQHGK